MAEQEFTTQELESEEWRDVVGYEGLYSVSNLGRVLSHQRSPTAPQGGLILKPWAGDYMSVWLCRSGKGKAHAIHQLVAHAFLGPPRPGVEPNHIDGVASNNRLENLEYLTHGGNIQHAVRTGRLKTPSGKGVENGNAKLTEADVREIWALAEKGKLSHREIAERFGVHPTRVWSIHRRKQWTHVL
jgi:hypothetical protein